MEQNGQPDLAAELAKIQAELEESKMKQEQHAEQVLLGNPEALAKEIAKIAYEIGASRGLGQHRLARNEKQQELQKKLDRLLDRHKEMAKAQTGKHDPLNTKKVVKALEKGRESQLPLLSIAEHPNGGEIVLVNGVPLYDDQHSGKNKILRDAVKLFQKRPDEYHLTISKHISNLKTQKKHINNDYRQMFGQESGPLLGTRASGKIIVRYFNI